MSDEIVCARCGVDDHLTGTPAADGMIELHCARCDVAWLRNPHPHCPRCGGDDMEAAPRVLLERSRGTQMSIQGVQREFLCRVCDAEQIRSRSAGHLPGRLGDDADSVSGPSISQQVPGWTAGDDPTESS